ncbi:MAG: hypothetical protein CVU56_23150 [Deltaproteobacteria bacterium HGW-Deltaproteobacteria-14]|jgi:hypothetical protein|nr:MAG: hypothetical protein CVU56_23150 [Deltaproteobacteria bacterium HGW-Deltaproteobacteria-14]
MLAAGALLLATSGSALAAADPGLLPTEGDVVKAADKKPEGWDPALTLSASVALSSNSNVVGQPDGASWTFGLNLLGRLDYLSGMHDWRNTLKIQEVVTRTPVLDAWVKTADQLFIESVYYLKLRDDLGPFASLKLETPLFRGYDLRQTPVTYIDKADGTTIATDVDRLRMTEALQPLALKESLGVFYRPIETKAIEVDIRAGFGAQEIFAEGGRVLADDSATPEIEISRLTDFVQAGAVIGVEGKGTLEGGRIVYSAHAEVMFPLINDDPTNRSVLDLTNFDLGAKISFKLFEWASLDYEIKAFRLPALVEEWQVQNNLLLSFSYSLIE